MGSPYNITITPLHRLSLQYIIMKSRTTHKSSKKAKSITKEDKVTKIMEQSEDIEEKDEKDEVEILIDRIQKESPERGYQSQA